MVAAIAISGRLDFNPLTDSIINNKGDKVKLEEPTGWELPPKGFEVEDAGYIEPSEDGSKIEVVVSEKSERLQLLEPFKPWNGENIINAKLLIINKVATIAVAFVIKFPAVLENI